MLHSLHEGREEDVTFIIEGGECSIPCRVGMESMIFMFLIWEKRGVFLMMCCFFTDF
jgi:hypothetical protein